MTQAARFKADLLVTHHPLLFEPLSRDNILGPAGRTLTRAVREGLSVYSAHTNLDASPRGINESLADLLDLREKRVLQETGSCLYKLVVFVPPEQLEKVRSAAFSAGAGQIGDYSGCSFTVEGTGSFLPGEGASPAIGQTGKNEMVREVRLELSVTKQTLDPVLLEIRKIHPYEEPAIDIYSLVSGTRETGLGISGVLPRAVNGRGCCREAELQTESRSLQAGWEKGQQSQKRCRVCRKRSLPAGCCRGGQGRAVYYGRHEVPRCPECRGSRDQCP